MIPENDNPTSSNDFQTELSAIAEQKSLREYVSEAMQRYFQDLDGQDTKELYLSLIHI